MSPEVNDGGQGNSRPTDAPPWRVIEELPDRPDGTVLDEAVRAFADKCAGDDELTRASARSTAQRLLAERHVPAPAALLRTAVKLALRQSRDDEGASTLSRLHATVQPPALAYEPDIPARAAQVVAECGVVGEDRLVQVLCLAMTSRLLPRPISVVVKSPSSAGKSFTVERVCELFPPEAYVFKTGMSEHALAYGTESLVHRMIVVCEAVALAGDTASYFLRSLLSEGRIVYDTVDKTDSGLECRTIVREGPTGVILTTTAVSLHPENETRMLSITATDTPAQTRAVMLATARGGPRTPPDLEEWWQLQTWLAAGECHVSIPYANDLAAHIPPVAVRLRRDFRTLLTLIEARALLHSATRERDAGGRIVATMDDYVAVRELVADLMGDQVQATVSATVRETVQAIADLRHQLDHAPTYVDLAQRLGLDKSAAQRRAKTAEQAGYLRNEEDRRGKPARLTLGEHLPEEVRLLPDPYELSGCTVACNREGIDTPLAAEVEHGVQESAGNNDQDEETDVPQSPNGQSGHDARPSYSTLEKVLKRMANGFWCAVTVTKVQELLADNESSAPEVIGYLESLDLLRPNSDAEDHRPGRLASWSPTFEEEDLPRVLREVAEAAAGVPDASVVPPARGQDVDRDADSSLNPTDHRSA